MSTNKYYTSRSTERITFRGVDMSSPRFQVNQNRAMDMCNYIWRNRSVQKRYGTKASMPEIGAFYYYPNGSQNALKKQEQFVPVYDMWWIGDTLAIHKGSLIYIWEGDKSEAPTPVLASDSFISHTEELETHIYYDAYEVPNERFGGIVYGDALWLLTGKGYLKLYKSDGKWTLGKVSDMDVYVPLTTMGITADGSGIGARTTIESANLLTSKRKNGISPLPNDKGPLFTYTLDSNVDGMKSFELEISSVIPKKALGNTILSSDGRYKLLFPNEKVTIPVYDGKKVDFSALPIIVYDNTDKATKFYTLASDRIELVDATDEGRVIIDDDGIYSEKDNPTSPWEKGLKLRLDSSEFDFPVSFFNLKQSESMFTKTNPFLSMEENCIRGKGLGTTFSAWGIDFPLWGLFFSTFSKPSDFRPINAVSSDVDIALSDFGDGNYLGKAITAKYGNVLSMSVENPTGTDISTFKLHTSRTPPKYIMLGYSSIVPPTLQGTFMGEVVPAYHLYLTDDEDEFYYGYVTSDSVVLFDNWLGGVDGDSNITATFHRYGWDGKSPIDSCTFGILYGASGVRNRLFVSGNDKYPNRDWVSGEDPTYFPDDGYMDYGSPSSALCGYGIASDGSLMAVKKEKDGEATIYYRKATLGIVTDDTGTQISLPSGSAVYSTSFSLDCTASKTGGIAPNLFTDFAGDVLFVSAKGQIVGLDTTGTTSTEKRVVSTRSTAIDRVIEKEVGNCLWDDNENLYYPTKNWLFVASSDYEWFKLSIPNVTCFSKHDGTIYYGNRIGEIREFTPDVFLDENTYLIPDGAMTLLSGTKFATIADNSDLYRIITLDAEELRKEFSNEPKQWADMTIAEREEALEKKYKDNLGELQLKFPKYDCRWYGIGHNVTASVGYDKYTFTESRVAFENVELVSFLIGKTATVTLGDRTRVEGTLVNDTQPTDRVPTLRFISTQEINGELKCEITFDTVDLQYEYAEGKNLVQFFAVIMGVTRFELFISGYDSIELKGLNPVKSWYLAAPFTAGTLCYKKAIWSYTINSDTYDENFTTIYRATDSNHIDSMVVADMGTKFLANNALVTKYSLSDVDYRQVAYDRMRVPNSFTAFKPMSVAFVVFNFKSDLPRNSVLTTMDYTYSLAKTAFGRM